MLTYLNGPANIGKLHLIKKIISANPAAKVLKKVAGSGTVKKAGAHHKAVKAVGKKHPLAAGRIKREAHRRAKAQQFEEQGNPAMLDDQNLNTAPQSDSDELRLPTQNADGQEEIDFMEQPSAEDSTPLAEETDGGMGVLSGRKNKPTRAEKNFKKKTLKNAARAQKPRNVRRKTLADAKASKRIDTGAARKSKGLAKTLKAKSGKGKDLVNKLIDTGAGLLNKQTSGGADAELPDNLPVTTPDTGKSEGIPKPVLYGGAALLLLGVGYMATRKK